MADTYTLGSHTFRSRLIIGSGKYETFEQNRACVTVDRLGHGQ